ncbi:flagella biosynthesis chaperone for FliD, FliT [Shewanella benthica]|uniref:flagella biosynthesis chaperone for FliD, FliT n=1 Tax=Shewanella benthica TaxID=43661 RepID=UPI00187A7CB3|nr:flagella biosynthesis chaperone for FliD, FliT [Shewanella benthica]MBE7213865.1 flagella biosynthesis chaperone for FliD, FliT [Shewanella benthica]MCL1061771.1 flagella biosynthesis chaperone for FliD, FliT [Shewanella benthica]
MMTKKHQLLVDALDRVTALCFDYFSQIRENALIENDDLVSNLLSSIDERQKSLDALIADSSFVERAYLEQQLELTYSLKVKAKMVMAELQLQLQSGKQSQRQVNVYISIDANR